MIKITVILSILACMGSGCGVKQDKPANNNHKENRPFRYDESNKMLFSGAFAVSPEYFAEITLDTEAGKLTTIINGQEIPFDLAIQDNLKELFEPILCISTEDLNEDGYMDFILTPNCSARFPASYVYLFDKDKKCFVAHKDEENINTEFRLIGNTIGFIRLIQSKEGTLDPSDPSNRLVFMNDDGSSWLYLPADLGNYSSYVDQGLFKYKDEFSPWAFESGIEVFAIRCVAKTDSSYFVVVNEDANIAKQLRKNDYLKFETVEEHVSNILLSTDLNINPVRTNPSDDASIVNTTEADMELIVSVERKGDWVKIKNLNTDKILGWIRWKKDGRFMIGMYYSV